MAKKVKEEVAPKTVLRSEEADLAVENRLIALYRLQQICSQIDKIRIIRGELPLEVQDLEDETEGLMTRIGKIKAEIETAKEGIAERKIQMQECDALINKYSDQQNNVRNNREYESLAKEIEFQELEKQLCEKKIRDFNAHIESYKAEIDRYNEIYEEKLADLEQKKSELDEIIKETEENCQQHCKHQPHGTDDIAHIQIHVVWSIIKNPKRCAQYNNRKCKIKQRPKNHATKDMNLEGQSTKVLTAGEAVENAEDLR